jgi:hypothetical protein
MTVQYFSPVPSGYVTNGAWVYTSSYSRPSWATRLALYLFGDTATNAIDFQVLDQNANVIAQGSPYGSTGDKYLNNQPITLPSGTTSVRIKVIGTSVTGSAYWYMSGLWFS